MKYISSAPDKQWVEKEAAALAGKAQLSLNGQVHQTVRGFGGCFNELSQIAMESLTEQQRSEIMDALFSEENGCNFKVCRVSIGANDYAAEWYSCDEVDGDYELKHFNIERPLSRSYRVNLPSSLTVNHPSALVYSTRPRVYVYGMGAS